MFAPEVYEERRNRLQERLRTGLVLLPGRGEADPAFRQESTFLYFTGVDQPGHALLLDLDQGTAILHGDEPAPEVLASTGLRPGVAELAWRAGLAQAAPFSKLADRLARAQAQGRPVHFLPPAGADARLQLFLLLGLHPERQAAAASAELGRAVAELRAVKDGPELAEIERAMDLSADMHLAAMRMARPGLMEAEIAARVTEVALATGSGLSHPVIATTHGEITHNRCQGVALDSTRLVLLNAGAQSPEGYAGDLTSTFPAGRSFSARQKELYQIVLNALADATAMLRPGVWFQDVHIRACKTLADGLKAMGLMKGDVDAAVAQGAHALFFPHGLGHMLGLDVNDMDGGDWMGLEGRPRSAQFGLDRLRLARELKAGFVCTLEPGIYFIPHLMDRWQAEGRLAAFIDYPRLEPYRAFGGIRIGETCAVLEHGCRRLGKPLPRVPSEIEVIRGTL